MTEVTMPGWFHEGGIFMWPLLLIALAVAVQTLRVALVLGRRPPGVSAEVEARLQAILFWGIMALVLGLLATLGGISQIAAAITLAGGVEPVLVWGGIGVALVTLLFGMLILIAAAIAWFALRQWYGRRLRTGEPGYAV
jgi:biopolymer transport protein ExbB/TolQ